MPNSKIHELTDANIAHHEQHPEAMIVFSATWCGPCKAMAPTVELFAEELGAACPVAKVDIEQARATAQKYRIRSVPTTVYLRGGVEVSRHVGVATIDRLRAMRNIGGNHAA